MLPRWSRSALGQPRARKESQYATDHCDCAAVRAGLSPATGFVLRVYTFREVGKLRATARPAMTPGAPNVDSPQDVSIPVAELRHERVVVRRRRTHSRHRTGGRWAARTSRRRVFRAFAVCAGILVLMAVGLYFGLESHALTPAGGSRGIPAIASPAVTG